MDRLSHLRGEAGGSRDSTLDTTSPPSESFMTANESSSKYFSLSEVDGEDSTFDISSIKDVSLASTNTESEGTITNTDELISNLSPIGKKSDMLDSYKIGTQIEAANILSGGVDIFEDNDNSYDGDELVIDDNVDIDDKSNSELKQPESLQFKSEENIIESTLINEENDIASKDTEVVLQIDGKNVDAIDIGNGLYLYRKEGQEELAAVQIIDDDQQQTSFKFLKVRENAEGNLEVYEEIEIEVPKEVPAKEGKMADKKISSHVPIKDINKVISESSSNKVAAERKNKTPRKEPISIKTEDEFIEIGKEISPDGKSEVNINGKMVKFSESRKSPVIGSFKPMTYHSTPNKEGIPLTKTMVDQQLHPNRHSDNVKKTIEVHTDNCKQRPTETPTKSKDADDSKNNEIHERKNLFNESFEIDNASEETEQDSLTVKNIKNGTAKLLNDKCAAKDISDVPIEQDNMIGAKGESLKKQKALVEDNIPIKVVNNEKEDEDRENIANIKDTLKEPVENEKTITDTVLDKHESTVEELLEADSENLAEINDVSEINKDDVMVSEPIQINDYELKSDLGDEKNKEIVKDNTHSDSQGKTNAERAIYNISSHQGNIEEIIVIDDSKIDETKMDDNILGNYKEDTKPSDIKSDHQENLKLKTYILTNNEESPKLEESVQDNIKIADNIQDNSKSSLFPDVNQEHIKKDRESPFSEMTKNSQSKIPILTQETNKMIEKPISTNKGSKDVVLDKTPPQSHKAPEESQKNSIKVYKIQDEVKVVPETHDNNKPSLILLNTEKNDTNQLKKENHVLKKEPRLPIQITVSQLSAALKEVHNRTNAKLKSDTKNVLPGSSSWEFKPMFKEPSATYDSITQAVAQKVEKQETKVTITNKMESVKDIDISKVPKEEEAQPSCSGTQDVSSTSTDSLFVKKSKNEPEENKEDSEEDETQPGKSKKAVPFGKWTATNRKEFLIKIKNRTVAPPATPSTSNQLKNSNDLNRRDVLQKIDSQRQSSSALAKSQESNKSNIKNETAFLSKTNIINKDNNNQESKVTQKTTEKVEETPVDAPTNETVKVDATNSSPTELSQTATVISAKKDNSQRTEVNYQDLIDKTIEGMIHRTVVPPKAIQEEPNQNAAKDSSESQNVKYPPNYEPTDQATLDAIEMKMNELHGIPFIERPPHELPVVPITDTKPFSKAEKEKQAAPKTTKIPNLLPFTNKTQEKIIKENVIEVDSEEEIIEHEPITGDINLNQKNVSTNLPHKDKPQSFTDKSNVDESKKGTIITEKDFEKFARRNSITYENCLTVSFEGKEPHNVIQTIVAKDPYPKTYSRNENARADPKAKYPHKYQNVRQNIQPIKIQASNKFGPTSEDSSNRNQSKFQKAYQSALTAKRQMECPITIIEDKPVKVVFMDNMEYVPGQLNVQGQELSPAKKLNIEPDNLTVSTIDSLDSEVLDTTDDAKSTEEVKTKTKHQRKQVLTPVDEPELELIEPKDLGLEVSPKKKRKTDEDRTDKSAKYPMRKKYYLLGSNTITEEKFTHAPDLMKNPLKETVNRNDTVSHKNTVSAIDSLVKAAELLEHQSENMNIIASPNPDSQQSTPVKRGRGRPRKYPLPEGGSDKNKVPSPQKKPRLIDAKAPKRDTTTDEDSDDEMIRENWTMGKINENIVCPICNKLFRTESVVFKHVKHCTGPSPSRSGSDKRSPRRMRPSQESDSKSIESKSDDMDIDDDKPLVVRKETTKERKSKDSIDQFDDKYDVIVIEDTPVKEKTEKAEKEVDDRTHHEPRKPRAKMLNKNNGLVCEFCGKTFRQLSYLVSHKLQHKKDEPKKIERDVAVANKTVYSCEVCKKEFRKLHHLVQHRIIHNTSSVPARSLRKSSSEHPDNKNEKEPSTSKQSDDPSAGFRCEPCDKSFRKLHHLVEHRETHDGINRQKTIPVIQNEVEKETPISLHQCEVCKKTFRKLHHLIEHKEQHVETSSEKSDDKSVKSSLSTRDIIHECSLCYMVFPNEHSLNKHTIICQRKKRQSKQAKPVESETVESIEDVSDGSKVEEKLDDADTPKHSVEEVKDEESNIAEVRQIELPKDNPDISGVKPREMVKELLTENVPEKLEIKSIEPIVPPNKREFAETDNTKTEVKSVVPEKIKKVEVKEIIEAPKKKSLKEKSTAPVSKRLKTTAHIPVPTDVKPMIESSDDDEVRYMLNPNFKVEDTIEEKVFMKVRANKRSSLQIERPNSKDLVKRRTSLQHPPKIPRLKPKAVEPNTVAVKYVPKAPKLEPVASTDSDDSETVKYSFPKTIPEKSTKTAQDRTPKDVERKIKNKSLADKRKSLSGIAKRKSLGKVVTTRHKPSPMKQTKRRTMEVEHRCDCGQLFSSAALLSRHTTLAHTPPRIRRRRSPQPEEKPIIKPAPRKSGTADKTKQTPASRKSSTRSDSSTSTAAKPNKNEARTRKTLDKETKTPVDARKPNTEKSETKSSVKTRRPGAHRGVPVPEKMRKLMQKNNK